jgi:hypothetical protein
VEYGLQVAGCRVQGAGCKAQGAGCKVQGGGCRFGFYLGLGSGHTEVTWIVIGAARIERRLARGTSVIAFHVFIDAHFISAYSAKNCLFVPLISRPSLWNVISRLNMTFKTWEVLFTAFEFDRDNVESRVVMFTPRLCIDRYAVNDVARNRFQWHVLARFIPA